MKVAITHLVCSHRQPQPSDTVSPAPHQPSHEPGAGRRRRQLWKALTVTAQFSYCSVFLFSLLIIQLIHVSQLTEPHYCGALSHLRASEVIFARLTNDFGVFPRR